MAFPLQMWRGWERVLVLCMLHFHTTVRGASSHEGVMRNMASGLWVTGNEGWEREKMQAWVARSSAYIITENLEGETRERIATIKEADAAVRLTVKQACLLNQ